MAKAPRPSLAPARAAIITLKPRRAGRPPTGPRGERVSDYAPIMIRLPQPTKAMLEALRAVSGTPVWQIIDTAVKQYVERLPHTERKLIADVKTRRARLAREN
jgi:hypothetical protein